MQGWKKRQTLQTRLCYFSQLVLIFRHRARKTMREECFTHCIISTRAISTSAISINNAFSCYLQIFHSFFWSFTLFCREFVGANIFGPFLYLCYFNRLFHLCVVVGFNWKGLRRRLNFFLTFESLFSETGMLSSHFCERGRTISFGVLCFGITLYSIVNCKSFPSAQCAALSNFSYLRTKCQPTFLGRT